VIAQLRHTYHLDQPFFVQYLDYLKGIIHWDFGTSYSGRPVSSVMAEAFPVTIRLALLALLFEGVLGIGAGLIAGLRRGGIFDASLLLLSLVVIAVPIFVIGFFVQIVFGVKLGWINPTVGPEATWGELIVPAMVLGSVSFAYVLRLTRDSITENLSADWVRTATAKGLSRRRVVSTHVLRNSLIPVATFLGADLGSLMAGAIITEGIFNIPGVGHALYQAIVRGEGATVVSIVTVLVLIYIATSLVVDLLYAVLDPRIRYV
jgi:oligopeptide transport system permease protein